MSHLIDDKDFLLQCLREDAQLTSDPVILTPLSGGVSSDIYRVEQGDRSFIVKRALERLRVAAEWEADISRNATEYAFFQKLSVPLSGLIPQVYFRNPDRGYFTMEYLGGAWENWRTMLLKGRFQLYHARLAGALLAKLHAATWKNIDFARDFDTTENFRQLRTDPYLRTSAEKNPEVANILRDAADRLESTHLCLVHGDFSPKNLLIGSDRIMLLDAEVAWFGDPAFDIAFFFALLLLKGLYHSPKPVPWPSFALELWHSYTAGLQGETSNLEPVEAIALNQRSALLIAAIQLARIDGKSPVEHLSPAQSKIARDFAVEKLLHPDAGVEDLIQSWARHLSSL